MLIDKECPKCGHPQLYTSVSTGGFCMMPNVYFGIQGSEWCLQEDCDYEEKFGEGVKNGT